MMNLFRARGVSSRSEVYGSLLKSAATWLGPRSSHWCGYSTKPSNKGDKNARPKQREPDEEDREEDEFASFGIAGKPISEILKQLNKKVPDSLVKLRFDKGVSTKYIPWHIVNRIMNLHASEWSGEIRSVAYSPDGKSVTVVYRVTLYGTDAEIYRESSGSATLNDTNYGDPVQTAEAMAFRRACARFGLGLHLYHEDLL